MSKKIPNGEVCRLGKPGGKPGKPAGGWPAGGWPAGGWPAGGWPAGPDGGGGSGGVGGFCCGRGLHLATKI